MWSQFKLQVCKKNRSARDDSRVKYFNVSLEKKLFKMYPTLIICIIFCGIKATCPKSMIDEDSNQYLREICESSKEGRLIITGQEDDLDRNKDIGDSVDGARKIVRMRRDLSGGKNFHIKNSTKKEKKKQQKQRVSEEEDDDEFYHPVDLTVKSDDFNYPELPKEYTEMISRLNHTALLDLSMLLNSFRKTMETFDDYADKVKLETGFDVQGRTEFINKLEDFIHYAIHILRLRLYETV